jgi:hypothetical protein
VQKAFLSFLFFSSLSLFSLFSLLTHTATFSLELNKIGDEGATAITNALQHNSSITELG